MTRKDYVMIAKVLNNTRQIEGVGPAVMGAIVANLCHAFKLDNPAFDGGKFVDACKGLK